MLIKRRFLNTKVKIVTAVMTVGVVVGGALFTLPIDNAKGAGSPYPPTDTANHYQLYPRWSDEFDGTSLNLATSGVQNKLRWNYYTGGWKDENQQVQNCYTSEEENVNVSGGSLNLVGLYKPGKTCTGNTKTGDFTSGFVETRDSFNMNRGYVEARIKMPKNKSTWPGFWLSPKDKAYGEWPNSGEIDVVEGKGSNHKFAASDAHWRDKNTPTGQPGSHRSRQGVIPSTKFDTLDTTEWHTYGVKISQCRLEYFIDGELHHTITEFKNSNSTGEPCGPFNKGFFIRLNLAIGGNYIDAPWNDAHNSVGAADDFPATMSIDYVRVYSPPQINYINIPDANLRKALNKKLTEITGTTHEDNYPINNLDLRNITDLNLDNLNIVDLTGMEYAENLENLSLNHNSVSNLSPLSGLHHLKTLSLDGNKVTDLNPLKDMTSLKTLSLKENAIADIRPLTRLTSLTSLHLEDQRANVKPNDKSFASPLKDLAGNTVSVTNSAEVVNDTATPGNIQLLSLPASGASPILNAPWTRSVTLGTVSATFSGTLAIDTSAIPRAVQPQPQPANPSAAAHNPANKPQNAVSGLLANTGFNAFLGVIATLALVAAGLFILR